MNAYLYALCLALPIFGLAILNVLEVVSDSVAQPLFTLLPLLAVISINARNGCMRRKAA